MIDWVLEDYAHLFQGLASDKLHVRPGRRHLQALLNSKPLNGISKRVLHKIRSYAEEKPRNIQRLVQVIDLEAQSLSNPSDYSTFIKDVNKSLVTFIKGWSFSDPADLVSHIDYFKAFYVPAEKHLENITNFLIANRTHRHSLIGVHVRRGDYKTWQGGKYYFSDRCYKEAIQKFNDIHKCKKNRFVVCSNERVDLGSFAEFDCVKGLGNQVEDLYLLSQCDFLLGPPSTYSRWASMIGRVPLYQIRSPGCPLPAPQIVSRRE